MIFLVQFGINLHSPASAIWDFWKTHSNGKALKNSAVEITSH